MKTKSFVLLILTFVSLNALADGPCPPPAVNDCTTDCERPAGPVDGAGGAQVTPDGDGE